MSQVLIIELVCYVGVIVLLIFWGIRGILTEQLFAAFLAAPLSLIIITAGLDAYLSSPDPYPFGLIVSSIGSLVSTILSYLIARWGYRQIFPPK